MVKNTNLCVDLKTVMQNDSILVKGQCYNGIITRDSDTHYRFEEAIRKGRRPRNPKLFDGKHISMVRKPNGRYQLYMKMMSKELNRENLAFDIYCEIISALKIVD